MGWVDERLGEREADDDLATRVALARMLASTFGRTEAVRVGRYTLQRRLGAGGMGEVWAAHDPELARTVAIKLLPPGFPRSRCVEGRALARLHHAGAVEVFEIGEADGRVFVVMEYVEGTTLREWMATPRPWTEIVEVIGRVGDALADSHAGGLVHRDIKPDNVMLTNAGAIKLVDFGVALLDAPVTASQPPADAPTRDVATTDRGSLTGTLRYMAPEQLRGEPATPKSDQFALCVLAWEALGGTAPFGGTTIAERLAAIDRGPSCALPPACPRSVSAALRRGLSPDPAVRWPDVRALVDAIRARPRARLPVVLMGIVALVGGVAALVPGPAPCEGQAAARLQVADLAVAELQPYADAWRATYVEVCGDPTAASFDSAMACLDEGLQAAVALQTLVHEGRIEPDRIGAAARRMTPASACSQSQSAVDRLPPEQRDTYLAALRRFAEVRALMLARDLPAAEHAVDELRAIVSTIDAPSLAAQVEYESANIRIDLQDHRGGIERLERALAYAETAGDDPSIARAAIQLMRTYGADLRDDATSERYRRMAEAALSRYEPNPWTLKIFATARALVAERRGDYPAAIEGLREVVALPPIDEIDDVRSRAALAVALSRGGQHTEAIAEARRAAAEMRALIGAEHREMITMAANLGAVEAMGGELVAAEQTFTEGLRLARRELGERHALTSMLLHNLGEVAVDQGRPADGVPRLAQALSIRKEAFPAGHHHRRETFTVLARAQRAAGAKGDAIATLREFASELESAPSVDAGELANVLVDLAELEHERGHESESSATLRRAAPWLADPGVDPALVRRSAALTARGR